MQSAYKHNENELPRLFFSMPEKLAVASSSRVRNEIRSPLPPAQLTSTQEKQNQ